MKINYSSPHRFATIKLDEKDKKKKEELKVELFGFKSIIKAYHSRYGDRALVRTRRPIASE